MWNDLYYRIIRIGEDDNILTIVCMQDHDEMDYDHSRFLCAKGTEERLYFNTEEEAIKFLNDNINLDNIDPKYLVQTQRYNDSFYKD